MQDLDEGTPRQLAKLREDMEEHVAGELGAAFMEYRELRIAGTIALALGLACTTIASFI